MDSIIIIIIVIIITPYMSVKLLKWLNIVKVTHRNMCGQMFYNYYKYC